MYWERLCFYEIQKLNENSLCTLPSFRNMISIDREGIILFSGGFFFYKLTAIMSLKNCWAWRKITNKYILSYFPIFFLYISNHLFLGLFYTFFIIFCLFVFPLFLFLFWYEFLFFYLDLFHLFYHYCPLFVFLLVFFFILCVCFICNWI
jgi:hypothetical protein